MDSFTPQGAKQVNIITTVHTWKISLYVSTDKWYPSSIYKYIYGIYGLYPVVLSPQQIPSGRHPSLHLVFSSSSCFAPPWPL